MSVVSLEMNRREGQKNGLNHVVIGRFFWCSEYYMYITEIFQIIRKEVVSSGYN